MAKKKMLYVLNSEIGNYKFDFHERYFCECNKIYGKLRVGEYCNICGSSVRHHDEGYMIRIDVTPVNTGFPFRGIKYNSFNQCCEHYGVYAQVISDYAKKHNIALDKSLELHLSGFKFRNKLYSSVEECCETLNVDPYMVECYKELLNCTTEYAIECILTKYVANNKVYESFKEYCREHFYSSRPILDIEVLYDGYSYSEQDVLECMKRLDELALRINNFKF